MVAKLQLIKERIIKLDQVKRERDLSAKFGQYIKELSEMRTILKNTYIKCLHSPKVFPSLEYNQSVVAPIKKAVQDAKKLYQEIDNDPFKVNKNPTDKKVTNIRLQTKSATQKLESIWKKEITKNISKWDRIASVVKDLGAKGGKEFKNAVDSLRDQPMPENEQQVKKINSAKESLQNGITRLDLEGDFGTFLKSAVEGTATARDLLKEKVRTKMDEYDLWDSFQVKLGQ